MTKNWQLAKVIISQGFKNFEFQNFEPPEIQIDQNLTSDWNSRILPSDMSRSEVQVELLRVSVLIMPRWVLCRDKSHCSASPVVPQAPCLSPPCKTSSQIWKSKSLRKGTRNLKIQADEDVDVPQSPIWYIGYIRYPFTSISLIMKIMAT